MRRGYSQRIEPSDSEEDEKEPDVEELKYLSENHDRLCRWERYSQQTNTELETRLKHLGEPATGNKRELIRKLYSI